MNNNEQIKELLNTCEWEIETFERVSSYNSVKLIQTIKELLQINWIPSGKDYDRNIHHNPDASAWADLFMETFPNCGADHETMLGWFANAMMAMSDWKDNQKI